LHDAIEEAGYLLWRPDELTLDSWQDVLVFFDMVEDLGDRSASLINRILSCQL
jgi:hypothetical protein